MYKFNKPLFFSIIFHLLFFLAFSQQFSQTSLPAKKEQKKVKPIQATLYFPTQMKQLAVEVEVEVEKTLPLKKKSKATTEKSKPNELERKVVNKIPLTKKNQPAKILPKRQVTQKILTSDSSTRSISQNALNKLHQRLNNQALEHSKNDSYNQYLSDKNTIARSITKFNQLPEAKAKIKKVDCDANVLNTAIVITSGLLGGSVRCDSMPNLKEFLDKRAEEKR